MEVMRAFVQMSHRVHRRDLQLKDQMQSLRIEIERTRRDRRNSHYGNCSHIFDRQNGCKPYSVVNNCAVEWLINALKQYKSFKLRIADTFFQISGRALSMLRSII